MNKKLVAGIAVFSIIAVIGFFYSGEFFQKEKQPFEREVPIVKQNMTIDEKADKIVASMSKTEKIGQMVMIGIQGVKVDENSLYMLKQFHFGGIILFDRNMESVEQVKQLTKDLQQKSEEKVPLFIGIDEEGGNVVRMAENLTPPPAPSYIGQSGDIMLAYDWAVKTSKALKEMGINVNFAPVADISPDDERSYSAEANTAANFVRAAASGYKEENLIYTLKHFPGIGKGTIDSHKELSNIDVSAEVLDEEDLVPFKTIISENEPEDYFILVSHLKYPALDEENPASLSSKIMTDLLRQRLNYDGIIITDDMEMGAVSNHYEFGDVGVKAVLAGADIVLVCHEYEHEQDVYMGILKAVNNGTISQERIDESVKRIIKAKLLHLY